MNWGWIAIGIWYLILIGTIMRVLTREHRTPASRIAWILVITLIPYLGVVVYFVLGEVNVGKRYDQRLDRNARHLVEKFGKKEAGDWHETKKHLRNPLYYNVFAYTNSISPIEPSYGNSGILMKDADDTIAHILKDIETAKHSFHGLYYIWLDDNTGRAMAQALIDATQRGVKCRVLVDSYGSRKFVKSDTWKSMIDAGVDAQEALRAKGLFGTVFGGRMDLRNHRKITVIDNRITYIGSRNIADPEFRHKAKFAPWVDIMARMEGPIVHQNNMLFLADWMVVSDESIDDMFDLTPLNQSKDGFVATVVPDGPTLRFGAIPQLFDDIFNAAREEITITTPYFVPTEGLVDAICAASYSGIEVKMMFPHNNDSKIVEATSRSYYKQLLEAGVQIYEYKKGLLHSKIVVTDRQLAMIGSTNLDRRSFDLNYENNILFEDEKLASAIRQRQEDYMADCVMITLAEVNEWGAFKRLWNNAMAMMSPIM